MAYIRNPISVITSGGGGGGDNTTLTLAMTTSSPAEVSAYLNAVIPNIPELSTGKYIAINRKDWAKGKANQMAIFNIDNGSVKTDSAVRTSTSGNLSARSFTSTSGLDVAAGDTFEFIKVVD